MVTFEQYGKWHQTFETTRISKKNKEFHRKIIDLANDDDSLSKSIKKE